MKRLPGMANWCLSVTNSNVRPGDARLPGISANGVSRLDQDDDRHDDGYRVYRSAVADAVRATASDFRATHSVYSTSHGRASFRHPSSYRDYRDRQL